MKHLIKEILLASLGSFIGSFLGWLIGATLSGNYAVSMEFVGLVGYEAGGLIGGVIVSVLAATVIVWQLEKRRIKQPLTFAAPLLGGIISCLVAWQFPSLPIIVGILPGVGATLSVWVIR